jgi:hypothetical protein
MKKYLLSLVVALSGLVLNSYADVIIGNWEQSSDGWINAATGKPVGSDPLDNTFRFSTNGVTLGQYSLQWTQSGTSAGMYLPLQNSNGLINAFLANTRMSIDVSAPPEATMTGYSSLYSLAINADGAGYQTMQPTPAYVFGFPSSNFRTVTITWDYSALLSSIPANPTYIELILTVNNDPNHTVLYLDDARLSVPEPGCFAIYGLGAAAALAFWHRRFHVKEV